MRVAEDGGVLVNMTLHDHGCGTVEAFRMMIAEALSLQPEQIFLGEGDTALTPFDPGCFSSRTTFVLGQTALLCAQGLIEKLKDAVCDLYDVSAASLSAKDGTLTDGKNSWSYAQIVQDCHRQLQREVFASYQFKNTTNPGVTDAHFAHVEVDVYTGNVKILDYLAVHDIGRAINPEICRAQIQGAVQMGAGAALNEQMTIDKRGCATHSLGKYHILNAPQVPSVRVEFIEDGGTNGPFGCKSIGEVCHVPPAAVIVGAVNEALHADLDTIPLNQDAICRWVESHQEEVFS
jgi:xanthine dehydrogenase molybdenum-binding subunit